jgi:hypothetical protein
VDINSFGAEILFHGRDKMDMLDRSDKTGDRPLQQRDCCFQYVSIEVHREREENNVRLVIDRGMAYVDEHVDVVKEAERKVAGTVAGITADNHFKSGSPEGCRIVRRFPLEPGRELECHLFRPPLLQLTNNVRDTV